jgi:hypothetical protein
MRLWHFILRLWKRDKLLFILLALLVGVVLPQVIGWVVEDYANMGWRSILALLLIAYSCVRIVQIGRGVVGRTETPPIDKHLERAFRKGLIGSGHEIDQLIQAQGAKDEARRAMLWAEAASSLQAARRLRREIEEELESIDDILRFMADKRPEDKEGMEGLAMYRKEVEKELKRAAALIHQPLG